MNKKNSIFKNVKSSFSYLYKILTFLAIVATIIAVVIGWFTLEDYKKERKDYDDNMVKLLVIEANKNYNYSDLLFSNCNLYLKGEVIPSKKLSGIVLRESVSSAYFGETEIQEHALDLLLVIEETNALITENFETRLRNPSNFEDGRISAMCIKAAETKGGLIIFLEKLGNYTKDNNIQLQVVNDEIEIEMRIPII